MQSDFGASPVSLRLKASKSLNTALSKEQTDQLLLIIVVKILKCH